MSFRAATKQPIRKVDSYVHWNLAFRVDRMPSLSMKVKDVRIGQVARAVVATVQDHPIAIDNE